MATNFTESDLISLDINSLRKLAKELNVDSFQKSADYLRDKLKVYAVDYVKPDDGHVYEQSHDALYDEHGQGHEHDNDVRPNVSNNMPHGLLLSSVSTSIPPGLSFDQYMQLLNFEREGERVREASESERERVRVAFEAEQRKLDREHELKLAELNRPHPVIACDAGFRFGDAIKLVPKFEEKDVDMFFKRFEQVAVCNRWDKSKWVSLFQSQLPLKASKALCMLCSDDIVNYDIVKKCVLKAYEHVPEFYRSKFRSFRKFDKDSYVDYAHNMKIKFDNWIRSTDTDDINKLKELILLEQFLNGVSIDIKKFLLERSVNTINDAARLADEYAVVHKVHAVGNNFVQNDGTNNDRLKTPFVAKNNVLSVNSGKPNYGNRVICSFCKKQGHFASNCRYRQQENKQHINFVQNQSQPVSTVTNLKTVEHVAFVDVSDVYESVLTVGISNGETIKPNACHMPVTFVCNHESMIINGFKDTGSSISILREGVLPTNYLRPLNEFVTLKVLTGELNGVPLFKADICVDNIVKQLTIGVVPSYCNLPVGTDMLCGLDLLHVKSDVNCYPVSTRAQIKKQQELDAVVDIVPPVVPIAEVVADNVPVADDVVDDSDIVHEVVELSEVNTDKLIELQKSDVTLKKAFEQLGDNSPDDNVYYYVNEKGLLMRKFKKDDDDVDVYNQIVLPYCLRGKVLKLAHDVPVSSHLGITKTKNRILRYFYWPSLFKDVEKYVKTCDVCQRLVGRLYKAPMCKPPVIEQPFKRISIDITGPIRRKTQSGNVFILTVVDHATHFPEAYPIPDHCAKTIACCMMDYFSRYGIPEEILHDLGTEFTSELFQTFLHYFGVKQLKCSVAHPQTNSMVERFHGVLKKMLKAYVDQHDNEWDKALCFVLFAYREVPIAEYGYSPFELVYGRYVRGPLGVLYDAWWQDPEAGVTQTVVQFMLETREKVQSALDFVHDKQLVSQEKAKERYDENSRLQEFEPGDLVLALQNVDGKPLCTKFAGPYKIIRKVTPVDYLVEFSGHRRSERLLHVNMLKKYVVREEFVLNIVDDDDNENYVVSRCKDDNSELDVKLAHLTDLQKDKMKCLLNDYEGVVSNKPGCTDIVEHRIILRQDAKPVSMSPYRMSPASKEKLEEEVQNLLKDGLIEQSVSEWSSPAMVVPKPDGTIRCVIDYRKANSMFEGYSYPIARIDDLIDKVQQSKFLTKLDLTKGFYQVKLEEDSKKYTAFCTPSGLYQWTRLPFGLKSSPTQFQYMMSKVLSGLGSYCGVYIDDVLIFSNNFDEHMIHVAEVFSRLRDANLTVKLAKCCFACDQLDYLGHVIGKGKMSPREAKVKALLDLPRPTTKKRLQSFLGSVQYYQRYIANYAELVSPLTDLLRCKNVFKWSEEAEKSFVDVKRVLSNKPVLNIADFSKPFALFVDASNVAVGAVLTQFDSNTSIYKPVCYFSKKLSDSQRNYCTTDKEALALVLAVRNFHVYLMSKTVVFSDHEPLKYINRMASKSARVLRWSLELQYYDIEVKHVRGSENITADLLSRIEHDAA